MAQSSARTTRKPRLELSQVLFLGFMVTFAAARFEEPSSFFDLGALFLVLRDESLRFLNGDLQYGWLLLGGAIILLIIDLLSIIASTSIVVNLTTQSESCQ